MLESLTVPDWDFGSSASVMYPSLEAAGKVQARQSRRDEKRLLQKLIEGTVRLGGSSGKSTELFGENHAYLWRLPLLKMYTPRNLHFCNTSACTDHAQ